MRSLSEAFCSRTSFRVGATCVPLLVLLVSNHAFAQASLEDAARQGIFVVFDGAEQPFAVIGHASADIGAGATRRLPSRRSEAGFSSWVIASRAIRRGDVPAVTSLAGRAVRVVHATGTCDATLGAPVVIGLIDSMVMRWQHELRGVNRTIGEAQATRYAWSNGIHAVVAPIVGSCAQTGLIVTTSTDARTTFFPRAPASTARDATYAARYETSAQGRAMRQAMASLPADWTQPVVEVHRWTLGATSELALIDGPILESCATSHFTTILDGRTSPPSEIAFHWSPDTLVVVLDLDGDGALELVFSHDEKWSVRVMRLQVGSSALVPLAEVDLSQSMGC